MFYVSNAVFVNAMGLQLACVFDEIVMHPIKYKPPLNISCASINTCLNFNQSRPRLRGGITSESSATNLNITGMLNHLTKIIFIFSHILIFYHIIIIDFILNSVST